MRFNPLVIASVLLSSAFTAHAQAGTPSLFRDVSTDLADNGTAWLSLGLGNAKIGTSSALAVTARENVAYGPYLLTVRQVQASPLISGPGVLDHAVLVGFRTTAHRLFVSASAGYSRSNSFTESGPWALEGDRARRDVNSPVNSLAYDVALHGADVAPGLALSLSGLTGGKSTSYASVSVSLELGWFGRDRISGSK